MRKLIATILTLCIALHVSALSATASTRNSNDLAANLRMQSKGFSPNTMLKAKLNENNNFEREAVAPPTAFIGLMPTELAAVGDADPTPQATPPSPQNPPAHHNHLLRDFLIISALGAVFYVVLASLDK